MEPECFTYHPSRWGEFSGADIRSTSIRVGDVLAFSRGVVHTFNTDSTALVLLSYHSPFIPLDDPRQYSLPAVRL